MWQWMLFTLKMIDEASGNDLVGSSIWHEWFVKFKKNKFNLRDKWCSSRLQEFWNDNSQTLLHDEPPPIHSSVLEFIKKLGVDHPVVVKCFSK